MDTDFKYTPEKFDELVRRYHKSTETAKQFPDLAGLKNALDIEDDEYEAICRAPEYHRTVLWAMRRRESFLMRAALTAKNTTGIKMLLAQPENGGYVEKPVGKEARKIEVWLGGMVEHDNSTDSDGDDDSGSDDLGSDTDEGDVDTAETTD